MDFLKLNLFILLISASLYPQFNPGAKQIALSNSDIASASDVFTIFSNPAALSLYNWRETSAYYSPQPLGFKELSNYSFAHSEYTPFGSFAAALFSYGFELYKETHITFAYSRNIKNQLFIGLALNYYHLSIKNYGNDVSPINISALYYLTKEVRTAFSLNNLNQATWGNEPNQIPTIFSWGISYELNSEILISSSIEKEVGFKPSLQAGLSYDLIEYLSLRGGFSTFPAKYSTGFSINYNGFQVDYSLFSHDDFGLTHQAGIVFSFPQPGSENNPNLSRINKIRNYLGYN